MKRFDLLSLSLFALVFIFFFFLIVCERNDQFAITHRDWGRDYGPSLESWVSALESHREIKKAMGDLKSAERIEEERRIVHDRLELLQNRLFNITPPSIVL